MTVDKVDLVPAVETPETVTETGETQESQSEEQTSEESKEETSEETKPEGEEKPEEEHKENRVQRRISKLTREKYQLKGENEALKQMLERMQASGVQTQQPTDGKPTREQFADEDAFIDALTDWKLDQKLSGVERKITQRQTEAQAEVSYSEKVIKARELHADYDEVVEDLQARDYKVEPTVNHAIVTSDYSAEILYHLGTHPEEAEKIAKMNPIAAVRYIGRIEDRIEAQSKPAPKSPVPITKAPKPVSPVGTSGGVKPKRDHQEHPEDYTIDEWMEKERERKAKLNKR